MSRAGESGELGAMLAQAKGLRGVTIARWGQEGGGKEPSAGWERTECWPCATR